MKVREFEAKQGRLKEGYGAGYTLMLKDLELTNPRVALENEKEGEIRFTAQIKAQEYDWFAEHPMWAAGTDMLDEIYNGNLVELSGKVSGVVYGDYSDAEDAQDAVAMHKGWARYLEGQTFTPTFYIGGGWMHSGVPESISTTWDGRDVADIKSQSDAFDITDIEIQFNPGSLAYVNGMIEWATDGYPMEPEDEYEAAEDED